MHEDIYEFEPLKAGNYSAKLYGVELLQSRGNRKVAKLAWDITEGEFKGYRIFSYIYNNMRASLDVTNELCYDNDNEYFMNRVRNFKTLNGKGRRPKMEKDINELKDVVREMAETTSKLSEVVQRLMVEEAKRRLKDAE